MVDVVSIVIAVVSLLGSLVAAGFTGWISFYLDQVKRRNDAKALVHKYRDPLVLAAYDLQSRFWGFVQQGLLQYAGDEKKKDLIYTYTAFLIGQYFSWTYILRRQAQFLRFSTDTTNKKLNAILDNITNQFSLDRHKGEDPFMLWRGQQMAIGELMTMSEENGQLYCSKQNVSYPLFAFSETPWEYFVLAFGNPENTVLISYSGLRCFRNKVQSRPWIQEMVWANWIGHHHAYRSQIAG
jgi:hypothetical protein